ncbi:MAG: Ig-like domain repeat protein, partial [bacterium]
MSLRDAQGNRKTDTRIFTYDATRPSLSVSPGTGSIVRDLSDIVVTSSDALSGIDYTNDTSRIRPSYDSDHDGSFTTSLSDRDVSTTPDTIDLNRVVTGQSDGKYELVTQVADRAGNLREDTVILTYDTVNPDTSNIELVNAGGQQAFRGDSTTELVKGGVTTDSPIKHVRTNITDTNLARISDIGVDDIAGADTDGVFSDSLFIRVIDESTEVELTGTQNDTYLQSEFPASTNAGTLALTLGDSISAASESGDYRVEVSVVDKAGNVEGIITRQFTFDLDQPTALITTPDTGDAFNTSPIGFSGTASDPTSSAERVSITADSGTKILDSDTVSTDAQGDWGANLDLGDTSQ